jgi:hypothetical protein
MRKHYQLHFIYCTHRTSSNLGKIAIILQHPSLDHDFLSVERNTCLLVYRLLESSGGLRWVESDIMLKDKVSR